MLSSHLPAKFALAVQIQVANLSGRLLYLHSFSFHRLTCAKVALLPWYKDNTLEQTCLRSQSEVCYLLQIYKLSYWFPKNN